jgi:hypothetical protein
MKGEHDMNDDDDVFDEHGVLRPGRSIRVRMTAMDAAVIGLDGSVLSLHRPGFRISADEALQDTRERAYQQAKRVAEEAWKSPQRREQDAEAAALAAHDAVVSADDSRKIRDAAWHRMVERMCSAWKNP